MIGHFVKTRPDGGNHDLDHITAVDSLDSKPEHGKDDSRDDCNYSNQSMHLSF